jgi:hypothetical protein
MAFSFQANAIEQEYCNKLKVLVNNEDKQKELIEWVDINFTNSVINLRDVTHSYQGIRPGRWSLIDHDFDWGKLNFNFNNSRIMLMGLSFFDFEEVNSEKLVNSNLIESIFFSENMHYGILVKLKSSSENSKSSGVKNITVINDRITIICGVSLERGT